MSIFQKLLQFKLFMIKYISPIQIIIRGGIYIMKLKKSTLPTIQYSFVQGLYWGIFGSLVSFASIYLSHQGGTNTKIGILIAIANIISVALQPLLASLIDRAHFFNLQKVSFLLTSLLTLSVFCLLIIPLNNFMLISILYMAALLFLQTLMPFINSLGFTNKTENSSVDFGLARSAGSILFGVISWFVGFSIKIFGINIILIVTLIQSILLLLSYIPFMKSNASANTIAPKNKSNTLIGFAKNNSLFLVLVIGVLFSFSSYQMCITFLAQIMKNVGCNNSTYGLAIMISSILELPTMILFSHITKKVNCGVLIRISGIFIMIKTFFYLIAKSSFFIFVGQCMQPLGFALFIPASVYYVNKTLSPKDQVKGQAFMTAANTAGGVIGSGFGGMLIDKLGFSGMLNISTCLASIGMLLFFVGTKTSKSSLSKSSF